ncbi:DUF2804 domain-containing protein [Shewanella sp. WXL01]|nr:DUF2804 domain-containing protein [Shewanella sp. WXL01]
MSAQQQNLNPKPHVVATVDAKQAKTSTGTLRYPPIHTQIAPDCLIQADGKPMFGHFDGIVKSLGLEQFDYRNTMDKQASKLAKYFDYKQFQFVTVKTQRYIVSAAIADIRYLGSGFIYVYDIKSQKIVEQSYLRPPTLGYQTTPSPYNGEASISKLGSADKLVRFNLVEGVWQLEINTNKVSASLTLTPPALSLPMSLATPTAYNGWTYTQKHNALQVSGTLTVNDEPQPLNQALASYDFSAGYMRRETSWRWASLNANTEGGVIGLNLAAGVNETGANENVLWVNGQRHLLGQIQFEFDRDDLTSPWQIHAANGQVDLSFHGINQRTEKLDLLLLKSNFRQFIGYFDGKLTDNQGVTYTISQQLGLCEDHYAKW